MTSEIQKVRILVVGDSGVGKTSLVHLFCEGHPPARPPTWTAGCNISVMLHEYKGSDLSDGRCATGSSSGVQLRKFFVEFWDVSGHKKFSSSRRVFFNQINGILLVYDLTNSRSYQALRQWLSELVQAHNSQRGGIVDCPRDRTNGGGGQHNGLGSLPTFIIGNKVDLHSNTSKRHNTLEELHIESMEMSATHAGGHFDFETNVYGQRLDIFIQNVIRNRWGATSSAASGAVSRRYGDATTRHRNSAKENNLLFDAQSLRL